MADSITLEQVFHEERPRLLRWMTKLTENPNIAEDLVQETYVTAWENRHKLHEPSGAEHWLNAIAHNIYKRWLRRNGKQRSHELALEQAPVDALAEYQLEQSELSDMLDKALALLSPENRAILIARYLEEQPQAKVARDLGMSESAIAVRLHRGKLTLRKIIDAELNLTDECGWQSTRLWCGVCGDAHYEAKFDGDNGELILRCPKCDFGDAFPAWQSDKPELIQGLKTIKPAFNRLRVAHFESCQQALAQGSYVCEDCGSIAQVRLAMPEFFPFRDQFPGMHIYCPHCGVIHFTALNGVAGSSPASFDFERDNPRYETLTPEYLTYQGVDALRIRFQSLGQHDSLDTIFARDSYRILSTYRNGKDVPDES